MMKEVGKGDGTAGRRPNSQPGRPRYTERGLQCPGYKKSAPQRGEARSDGVPHPPWKFHIRHRQDAGFLRVF